MPAGNFFLFWVQLGMADLRFNLSLVPFDQKRNESQNRFDDRKATESEMKNRNLHGRIYSNDTSEFCRETVARGGNQKFL